MTMSLTSLALMVRLNLTGCSVTVTCLSPARFHPHAVVCSVQESSCRLTVEP